MVLGADSVIDLNGELISKPESREEALEILKKLNDNKHNLISSVCISRNGSMNNLHNVEKAMIKFQQLAKDAQSSGDPVLVENYLQHADHYLRRFNELNVKNSVAQVNKPEENDKQPQENSEEKEIQ